MNFPDKPIFIFLIGLPFFFTKFIVFLVFRIVNHRFIFVISYFDGLTFPINQSNKFQRNFVLEIDSEISQKKYTFFDNFDVCLKSE